MPAHCEDAVTSQPCVTSGVFTVYPSLTLHPFPVFCWMGNDDVNWMLLMRKTNNDYFIRSLQDYSSGFGDLEGDFWLGNLSICLLSVCLSVCLSHPPPPFLCPPPSLWVPQSMKNTNSLLLCSAVNLSQDVGIYNTSKDTFKGQISAREHRFIVSLYQLPEVNISRIVVILVYTKQCRSDFAGIDWRTAGTGGLRNISFEVQK